MRNNRRAKEEKSVGTVPVVLGVLVLGAVLWAVAGNAGVPVPGWRSEVGKPSPMLLLKARMGSVDAQYEAGRLYMRGNRWKEAVPWYEKAAAQGHAKAQNNLGVAYSEGRGVAVDKEKACRLFEQAHKQLNNRDSLENVALCNDQTGKTQNAFESYLSAAEQGSPSAMRLVGQMYDSGEGTAQSYEWAVYWYRQAVLKNDAQAMYLLASKYAQYQGVPKHEPYNAFVAPKRQGVPNAGRCPSFGRAGHRRKNPRLRAGNACRSACQGCSCGRAYPPRRYKKRTGQYRQPHPLPSAANPALNRKGYLKTFVK